MVRNKLFICKEYHIQPSEIDKFSFYEYEIVLTEIKKIQEEQEKERESHEKEMGKYNPKSMMRSMSSSMKPPQMPRVSMPKF